MQEMLSRYIVLAKRWAWLVILGIVICSGATFAISKFMTPVYQASATIIVDVAASPSSTVNVLASQQAMPTYAQLLTSPSVLNPVLVQHTGMTQQDLLAMMTVKPQPNTQLIELDVENHDPQLAMQLANEICQSFVQFSKSQLPGNVQILPAQPPIDPVRPKPLLYSGIGALVGMGLAIALIMLFEWSEDRLINAEELHQLLRVEILGIIPKLTRKQLEDKKALEMPTWVESYRMVCARLNLAKEDKQFKLVMVTSGLEGEGKSTVSANIARFLATGGKRVLLVEADLRRPTLDKHFQVEKRLGLASALREPWSNLEAKLSGQPTHIPGLYILKTEVSLSNSTDLLQSPQVHQIFEYFKKAPFDYVILDTPPLLPVADAQILAAHVHATILVVDGTKASRKVLLRSKSLLSRTQSMILGAVINKGQWGGQGYYYYSHYYTKLEEQAEPDQTPTISIPRIEAPVTSSPTIAQFKGHNEPECRTYP